MTQGTCKEVVDHLKVVVGQLKCCIQQLVAADGGGESSQVEEEPRKRKEIGENAAA